MKGKELIERVKKSHKWNLSWNFEGFKKYHSDIEISQKEWCQTIMTNVNQISAQIHMSCMRGPATTIIAHTSLAPLFGTLEYYDIKTKQLCSRYNVIFTNDINEYTMYVVADKWLDDVFIPKVKIGDTTTNDDGEKETEISEVDFIHIHSDNTTPEEIVEFRDKLIGKIVVDNLG